MNAAADQAQREWEDVLAAARLHPAARLLSNWRSSCATRQAAAICWASVWIKILWTVPKSIDSASCPNSTFAHGEFTCRESKIAVLDARPTNSSKMVAFVNLN